jgi:hypothetical protein
MSNRIEPTNIPSSKYIDSSSRYNNTVDVVYYYGSDDRQVITFTTYKRQPQIISVNDKFMIISAATEYRPDIVSNIYYGFPHLWWRIMEYNGIYDIYDFKLGVTIRLPEFV